uniref:Uncharacterized protein n=1 Tax=Tetranychus urticae TaxID=32264 RepID=T1KUA0_TETUR
MARKTSLFAISFQNNFIVRYLICLETNPLLAFLGKIVSSDHHMRIFQSSYYRCDTKIIDD